jgi:hypothetical protein
MMRLTICICALVVGFWCVLGMSGGCPAGQSTIPACDKWNKIERGDVLTVFITGNELGTLKPCGCSGGQLGGLDRRSAVFDSVSASKRLILDTGEFVEGDSEQDLIKFNIIIQAFSLLDYDLVGLSERDVEIAKGQGLLDGIDSVFNVISFRISFRGDGEAELPAKFTKRLLLGGKEVAVTVGAFDTESKPIEQIGELFTQRSDVQTVNILILKRCDDALISSIAKMGIVDCLVCPAESDKPEIIGEADARPLVISAGRLGKYVGRLQIEASSAAEGERKLTYTFSSVPVTENLPQEESLVELYKTYQQLVKEDNLLEKQPRFVLPNDLEYTGSKSCKLCHEYEYDKWSTKAHAHAYATLEKVGSQYDPECVVCHVVGMRYLSGFVSDEETGHLKDVGCENCHGPGSEHIRTLGNAQTTEPQSECTNCHTPEHSGEYAGNEELYLKKIVHWREPNASGDVQE